MRAPRFDGCRIVLNDSLPLRTRSATSLPSGAALLEELLPETGGLNYATTRNRMLAVALRLNRRLRSQARANRRSSIAPLTSEISFNLKRRDHLSARSRQIRSKRLADQRLRRQAGIRTVSE